MVDWQPIETAPKNGRDVLMVTQYGIRTCFWDEARGGVWSIWPGREEARPTHWAPLPGLPALAAFADSDREEPTK